MIELGRYLVGEAGIYVCRVLDRKVSRGEVFLVTDGGLHHHLSASFAPRGSVANEALMARNKALFEERWGPWQPHRYRDAPGFG